MENNITTMPQVNSEMQLLHLKSSIALNRNPDSQRCALRAKTDIEAINCWLNEYRDRPRTFRSYQKEIDRLLLWCVKQAKKTLSQLDRADLECYFKFCQNPQPQAVWCSQAKGRNIKRGSPQWRPFAGPLTPRSLQYAMAVFQSLFSYLVHANYLLSNPLTLMRQQKKWLHRSRELSVKGRILENDEWIAIRKVLLSWPAETYSAQQHKARLRFIIALLFYTGVRVDESVHLTWSAFQKSQDQWWLTVQGKGNKPRTIPIAQLMTEIVRYRRAYRKCPLPQADEYERVIPLTTGRIRQLLVKLGRQAAQYFPDDAHKQDRLRHLSPHMLRHLMATTLANQNVAREHIQETLGHESLATTDIYISLTNSDRYEALKTLELWDDVLEDN